MPNKLPQLELEREAYYDFVFLWYRNQRYKGMRFGQAFYTHFKLHKLANQDQLCNLYEKDKEEAHKIIGQVFVIK